MANPRIASTDPMIRNPVRWADRAARKVPKAAAASGTPRRTTRSGPNSMLIGEGSHRRWPFVRGRVFGGLPCAGGGRAGDPAARSDSEHGGEARPTGPAPSPNLPSLLLGPSSRPRRSRSTPCPSSADHLSEAFHARVACRQGDPRPSRSSCEGRGKTAGQDPRNWTTKPNQDRGLQPSGNRTNYRGIRPG